MAQAELDAATPEEREDEMLATALIGVRVVGLEGSVGLALEATPDVLEQDHQASRRFGEIFQFSSVGRNSSCHLLETAQA